MKLILQIILVIILLTVPILPATISVRTSSSTDDVTWSNTIYTNLPDAYIGRDAGSAQHNGMRFNITGLHKNDVITSATITFRSTGTDGITPCKQIIYCEDTAAPTTFSTSGDFTSRSHTTASVNWTVSAWTTGNDYVSVDFSAVLQEVVNRSDFAGTYIVVFLWDDPTTGNTAVRHSYFYDGSTTLSPQLDITFTPATIVTPPKILGKVSLGKSIH